MQAILVETIFHHSSERSNISRIHDVADGTNFDEFALVQEFVDGEFSQSAENGIDHEPTDADRALIVDAFRQTMATGQHASFKIESVDDPGAFFEYAVWRYKDAMGDDNFGIGPGSGSNKYDNIWLRAAPFVPNPAVVAELEAMSKEELVKKLVRLCVTRGY